MNPKSELSGNIHLYTFECNLSTPVDEQPNFVFRFQIKNKDGKVVSSKLQHEYNFNQKSEIDVKIPI